MKESNLQTLQQNIIDYIMDEYGKFSIAKQKYIQDESRFLINIRKDITKGATQSDVMEVLDNIFNESIKLKEASNEDVIVSFIKGNSNKSGSMKSTGDKLYSYSTVIADWKDGKIRINKQKYSQTTSTQQNLLRRLADNEGKTIEEVDAKVLNESFKEAKRSLSNSEIEELYKKYPQIDSPDYPKKVLNYNKNTEEQRLRIKVGGKSYIVLTSPKDGYEDVWLLESIKGFKGFKESIKNLKEKLSEEEKQAKIKLDNKIKELKNKYDGEVYSNFDSASEGILKSVNDFLKVKNSFHLYGFDIKLPSYKIKIKDKNNNMVNINYQYDFLSDLIYISKTKDFGSPAARLNIGSIKRNIMDALKESLQYKESYKIMKVGNKYMINQDGQFLIGFTFDSEEQAKDFAKNNLREYISNEEVCGTDKETKKESSLSYIKRVRYGKDSTPENDREYQLNGSGPVGTITEWIAYAKDKGYNSIDVIEKDGSKRTVKIN